MVVFKKILLLDRSYLKEGSL